LTLSPHPDVETPDRLDLTLTRRILSLTIPVGLTGQLDNLAGFADIFMVGQLGPAAISAVGISRQIIMVLGIMMIAVTTGTFAMVAQAIGAGSMERASSAAKQSFTLVSVLAIFLSAAGIFAAPYILPALSLKGDVVTLGADYLRIFFAGLIFMTLNFSVQTCLHGAGDTRTPLYISILISAVKLIFSYLLIFGAWGFPEMGVAGAALGTVIGRVVGVAAGFWVLNSGRFAMRLLPETTYRFNSDLARRLLKIGIPSAMQGLFRNGSNLVYVKFIALTASSTAAVAAFSIGNQMERVLRRASLSFGTSATALVGQSLGAKQPAQADQRGWTTLAIGVAAIIALGMPIAFFAREFMAIFTDAPEVIAIGIPYILAIALAEPFMCAAIVSGGSLRGAGDTVPALIYTLVSQWLIRLPAAYLLAFTLGYDVYGIWAALVIFSALQGVLTVRKYATGEWKLREI